MLEVSGLSVSYGAHRALEDVSIRIEKGEICVILGANGAGKSTLLKAVAGLVPALGGSIAVAGKAIANAPPNRIVEAGLALVPEGRGIFGDLSVAENLSLGAYGRQARAGEQQRLERVMRLFPRLEERRNQIARTMSGGEQQMVAIGRALMSNPAILMLDEPSLGLSPLLTRELFRSLKAVRETGVGILMVEQNARQSLAIADRGYLLENGRITGEGRAASLASDPAVQAAYLGGAASAAPKSHARSGPKIDLADASGSADALAAHAARIQREFVEARRQRSKGGYVNGHTTALGAGLSKGGPIVMNRQAHELSELASDYATRAASIQRHHIESMRKPVAPADTAATAAPGSDTPEAMAARAAAIHAAHVAARRALPENGSKPQGQALEAGELTKRQKKTLKQARKAARKAKKLAEKVLRAIG